MVNLVDFPGAAEFALDVLQALRPLPTLRASEWAEQNIVIPEGMSSRPGSIRLDAWQRQLLDLATHDDTRVTATMLAAQCGKTTIGDVLTLWVMTQRPTMGLLVHPTEQMGKEYVRRRLDPIIAASPNLRGLVGGGRRGGGDAILAKQFRGGGFLAIGSAHKQNDLAARPVEYLSLDETDRFPASAGTEGPPVDLAWRRTATFENTRRVYISSTPKGSDSVINVWWEKGTRHEFVIPCPNCGVLRAPTMDDLKWTPGRPDTARLVCVDCNEHMDDEARRDALAEGEWRVPEGYTPPDPHHLSFHGTVLLSSVMSLGQIARETEGYEDESDGKKVWTNTFQAMPYLADDGEPLDAEMLSKRAVPIRAPFSSDIAFIVCGADVQGDRIELVFLGKHFKNNIATVLGYHREFGDTNDPATFDKLDKLLGSTFALEDGRVLPVEITGIDANYRPEPVVDFILTQQAQNRRVVAVRGANGWKVPLIKRSPNLLRNKTTLFEINVNEGKVDMVARLRMVKFGPGWIHLADHLDPTFYIGLASEKLRTTYIRGYAKKDWVRIVKKNEPLDVMTYAQAVSTLVKLPEKTAPDQPTWREIGAMMNKTRQPKSDETPDNRYSGS